MVDIELILAWFHVRTTELRRNPDRGEMVNTAIVIGILAVIAITVGAILMAKARTAANNVQTQ